MCEKKSQKYLDKMVSWGGACTAEGSPQEPAVVLKEEPSPDTSVAKNEKKTRDPASTENLEDSISIPAQKSLGSLMVGFQLSQAVIQATGNGTGTFASDDVCPGISVDWDFPLNNKWSLFTTGMLEHMGFTTASPVDHFDSSASWLWSAKAGSSYKIFRDLALLADAKLQRRIFIYRESATTLGEDPSLVPEANFGLRYRFIEQEFGGLFLGAGVGYLFASPTVFSHAKSGRVMAGEVVWKNHVFNYPLSLGLNLERSLQDTDLIQYSAWNLGFTMGVEFGSVEGEKR